ncbi:MAG TPA: hypothetical protein VJV22_04745, partial [Acidobacteriaceae bacterium]|nr:hypothetical protein [Acidobacteriaceae bacterium]
WHEPRPLQRRHIRFPIWGLGFERSTMTGCPGAVVTARHGRMAVRMTDRMMTNGMMVMRGTRRASTNR